MSKFNQKIPMGAKVVDVLSGYEGIVVGYARHITGCDTLGIRPDRLDKEGKMVDVEWVDVTRVKVIAKPSPEVQAVVDGLLQDSGEVDEPGGPDDVPRCDLG